MGRFWMSSPSPIPRRRSGTPCSGSENTPGNMVSTQSASPSWASSIHWNAGISADRLPNQQGKKEYRRVSKGELRAVGTVYKHTYNMMKKYVSSSAKYAQAHGLHSGAEREQRHRQQLSPTAFAPEVGPYTSFTGFLRSESRPAEKNLLSR